MPNKTIYVRAGKDESLWDRAKAMAGSDGLSGVIAQALGDFVQRKEDEANLLSRIEIDIQDVVLAGPEPEVITRQRLGFVGRFVGGLALYSDLSGQMGDGRLYLTRAGRLLLVIKDLFYPMEPDWDYEVFDSASDLDVYLRNPSMKVEPEVRLELFKQLSRARGENWTTWID